MLILNGQPFETRPYDREVYDLWRAYSIELAKADDRPIPRFIAKHLQGVEGEDRRHAIAGWMSNPDWDQPTDRAVKHAMVGIEGTQFLVDQLCDAGEDIIEAAVTAETLDAIREQLRIIIAPTDADVQKANQALRERIAAQANEKVE